jgi:hypothetical protein
MASRWVALSGLFALVLVACGSSSDDDGSGGASNASAGAAGATSGGASSSGGSSGASTSGGSSSGGSAGAGGTAGVTPGVGCRDRTTNHVAGTRIRAKNAVTSDGDRSWQGWHDSERDEDCEFMTGADGKLRCLPYNYEAKLYFADTACSDPVVVFVDDYCPDTSAEYLLHTVGEGCATNRVTHVYELGATYDTAGGLYALDSSGTCAAATNPFTGTFYRKGVEVPATSFAEAEARTWEGPGQVTTQGITGADGLLQVRGWQDSEHGDVRCYFERAEDGVERCLPSGGLFETQYHAAGCAERLLSGYSTCPGTVPADYASLNDSTECGAGNAVYRRGALHDGALFENTGTCTAAVMAPEYALYTRGEQVPIAEFVATTVSSDEADAGRLLPTYRDSDDGACWFESWYDTTLDTDCRFELMTDGKLHCVPDVLDGPPPIVAYSDPDCTVEEAYAILSEGCPNAARPKYSGTYGDGTTTSCSMTVVVYAVGEVVEQVALPVLYAKSGEACVEAGLTPASAYFKLGARLPPSTFMEGTLMVE